MVVICTLGACQASGVNHGSTNSSPPGAVQRLEVADGAEQAGDHIKALPQVEIGHIRQVESHIGAALARHVQEIVVQVQSLASEIVL